MDDLYACTALFAEAADLIEGQGGMAAIDMSDDVGAGISEDEMTALLDDDTGGVSANGAADDTEDEEEEESISQDEIDSLFG